MTTPTPTPTPTPPYDFERLARSGKLAERAVVAINDATIGTWAIADPDTGAWIVWTDGPRVGWDHYPTLDDAMASIANDILERLAAGDDPPVYTPAGAADLNALTDPLTRAIAAHAQAAGATDPATSIRNAAIAAAHAQGTPVATIAFALGLTRQAIYKIIDGQTADTADATPGAGTVEG